MYHSKFMNSFSVFKNTDKKNDKAPDYNISMKIGEKYENVGACWLKEGTKGKFFSCQLSKTYQDKPGYHIEVDVPTIGNTGVPYPKEDISTDNIPF